jgi:hypothetical protein
MLNLNLLQYVSLSLLSQLYNLGNGDSPIAVPAVQKDLDTFPLDTVRSEFSLLK